MIGLDFAEKIRKEKEKDAKFNFLTPTDPYHAYYRSKVQGFIDGTAGMSSVFVVTYLTEIYCVHVLYPTYSPIGIELTGSAAETYVAENQKAKKV